MPTEAEPTGQEFGLEFNCDEGKYKFGGEVFAGTIDQKSGSHPAYYWHLSTTNDAAAVCIGGTHIAELAVIDDRDGVTIMRFENGQWEVEPKGNLACSIRDGLIARYDREAARTKSGDQPPFFQRKPYDRSDLTDDKAAAARSLAEPQKPDLSKVKLVDPATLEEKYPPLLEDIQPPAQEQDSGYYRAVTPEEEAQLAAMAEAREAERGPDHGEGHDPGH